MGSFGVVPRVAAQTTGGVVKGQDPVKSRKVLILAVADAKERGGGEVVGGTGSRVAGAIRDALAQRGFQPFISDHAAMAEGIKEAKELGYSHIVRCVVTEWEDNATEWSGKPDAVGLSLEVFNLDVVMVSSASHREKSSVMAIKSATPDRLLPKAIAAVLARLLPVDPTAQ
jgi:hypothetical protein